MKVTLNLAISVAVLLFATACSSSTNSDPLNDPADLPPTSSEGGPVGVFNPSANIDVYACEAPYYLTLRGLYLGTVTYTPTGASEETCSWDTTVQVRGGYETPDNTSVCLLSATYSYTLLEGDTNCADGALEGQLSDPLAASPNRLDWESPEWPVDLPMIIEPGTPDDTILPVSNIAADTREITWRFDGLDDIILIDSVDIDGLASGTLVKR